MSELEIDYLEKVKHALVGLEKTKGWLNKAIIAFIGASVILIGSVFLNSYRIARVEYGITQAVSLKAFTLIQQSISTFTEASISLVENKDHQEVLKKVYEEFKKTNDNIFMFTTEINLRGARITDNGSD